MTRKQVFIANVLKCRPPGNRDPQPMEIEACEGHLFRQIELIEPRVICSLGNFATKLLSGSPQGITRVRGVPQLREIGGRNVFLYPIFHPAAALYTPAMLEQLRADFAAPARPARRSGFRARQVPAPERRARARACRGRSRRGAAPAGSARPLLAASQLLCPRWSGLSSRPPLPRQTEALAEARRPCARARATWC